MAEGFGEFQSSEESEEVSVASLVQVKSDEELRFLPQLQEVSITTGGYSGTDTDQLQDNIETLNGGDKHGSLAYSSSNPESDENYSGKFLNPKCCDELVGHLALSSHRTYQEIIDAQQEQLQYYKKKIQQLELELGTRSFLDDKKKRNEKAYGQSSRTLACAKSLRVSLEQRPLEISNSLSDVELRQMKFLVKSKVNGFRLSKIREGFELFDELDANGALSCTYITDLLRGIQRFDLVEKLDIPLLGNAERADGAFHMDEDRGQEPNSTFHMEEAPEHEPRSHPNNPKILDRTTELSVIPPGNSNLDALPENPLQSSSYEDGLATAEGDNMSETIETEHGLSATAAESESQEDINQLEKDSQECDTENQIPHHVELKRTTCYEGSQSHNGQKMLDRITESPIVLNSPCDDLPQQNLLDVSDEVESVSDATTPTDKWMRFGARPKTRPPVKKTSLEPSLAVSSVSGINEEFIQRHSRDGSQRLESQHHCSTDASLPGASYMESMINCIEANRIRPYTVDDEAASRPDRHNRWSLPSFMREDERGYTVGGSTFEESLNGSGTDRALNSDHLPSMPVGNNAHVAPGNSDLLCDYSAGISNGALNGVLFEAESTAAHQYAPGNRSSNTAREQVALEAVVSEPWGAESANSRDSMSDRNSVTDCNEINAALLALAQRIQACVASRERQIEGEQQREARVRAWISNTRFQGQEEDFIIESLDSTPNSARALVRREAAIRASTEEIRRGPSSHSGPGEHSCVCLENNGSQACCVHGTIVPEICQPESAHNTCCKCLEDVLSGSMVLPCSHHVHMVCLVGMINNGELNCPICGRPFLWRG